MPKATAAAQTLAAPAIIDTFSPAMKLERLSVREKVKSALGLPKEGITSREAGHIDLVVSPSMFPTVDALKSALKAACAANGIEYTIMSESVGPQVIGVTFTNALMQRQVLWGARGHNRQGRVISAAPAPVAVPVVTVSQPEAKTVASKKPAKKTKKTAAAK